MDWQHTVDSFLLELRSFLPTLSDGSVLLDNVISFFRSIDWTEPWIITLLSSEVVLFLITLVFRRNLQIQTALFVFVSGFIYKAEFLNSICAQHWVKFSRQMYFDRNGIFWSSLISGPLLFILFCILVISKPSIPQQDIGVLLGELSSRINSTDDPEQEEATHRPISQTEDL